MLEISKFDDELQSINIIKIPLIAHFEGEFMLGPLENYHVHVIHLDLNNLRHFQVVRKQLVKVV